MIIWDTRGLSVTNMESTQHALQTGYASDIIIITSSGLFDYHIQQNIKKMGTRSKKTFHIREGSEDFKLDFL